MAKNTKTAAAKTTAPAPRHNKDGTRRLDAKATIDDQTSADLAACQTETELRAFGVRWGLTETELDQHAEQAPNWGQFRMVVGNRARGTQRRLAEFDGDVALAAHPREARKARTATKRAAAAATKAAEAAAKAKTLAEAAA